MSCQLICLFHSEGIADIKRKPRAARLREKEDGMGGKEHGRGGWDEFTSPRYGE